MINVGVLGSKGRMGQALVKLLEDHPQCQLSLAGTRENVEVLFESSDVVIDFTNADALSTHINLGLKFKKPLIIGTTGLQTHHHQLISTAAAQIPIIVAPNMSIGITLLTSFIEKAARFLDDSYDIEISEVHHRHKKDAPSGSSLAWGKTAAKGRGKSFEELRYDHDGKTGRPKGAIGFAVQRGGAVIGDHTLRFMSDEEVVELSHRGLSRTLYARGALRAAKWVAQQKPGLYSMADVLGL